MTLLENCQFDPIMMSMLSWT